jgi:hypothetical protein
MGDERLQAWPIAWSAVWVGALSAVAVALIIGLIGHAFGAHQYASGGVDWRHMKWGALVFSVGGAFFAFVVGGWVTGRIAGFSRAEPAMLHGAIAWLLTLPFLMVLGAMHAGSYLGGWYGALSPVEPVATSPSVAAAVRNSAVATALALLIGLVGGVLGGWMASGEPMTLMYYRRRAATPERPRRAA